MFSEIAGVSIFGTILFYSAINMGFLDPYISQLNNDFWVDAIFNYNAAGNIAPGRDDLQPVNNLNSYASTADGNYELKIPSDVPADTSKNKLYSDTSKSDTTHGRIDTTKGKKDTLAVEQDTAVLNAMARDSTARLKYFQYKRNDEPYVTLSKPQPGQEFFAQPSQGLAQRRVQIDSTGKFVEIIDEVAGMHPKIILRLPIEEYIKMQLALNNQRIWNGIADAYEMKGSANELGELIKSFTNFEIPLPSVGVLSIFGKPKISLRIGGAVDIHGAWRSQTTQGVTASLLGNTTNEPDFQQQVQINVNGTIGDKLNINADWNTERTFEYENQLKIKYTGYEDEIVQSVEAGNVSLQTSPLVGGGEALFGVKAKFQLGPLTLTTLASQKKGQTKTVAVSGGSTSQTFSIRAYDYATNNFFLDTVYASTKPEFNFFYKYYGNATPIVNPAYRIVKLEVWKSKTGLTYDKSKERQVNAYLNLPPLSQGGTYPAKYFADTSSQNQGLVESGRFTLLQEGVDYTLQPNTGYITFNAQIQDQDAIAVAYEVENSQPGPQDDSFYGQFLSSVNNDTSKLVLKLIKPAYLKPQYKEAWKLMLKNIYPLNSTNINQNGFVFQIKYEIPGQDPVTEIQTDKGVVKLLNAFGLDKYDASLTNPTPDDQFDWRPTITILPAQGEVIFPYLEPFGKDMAAEGIPDSLAYQSVYDTTSYYAQQDKIHDRWEMTGKFSGEASSVYQLGFNIVENSVRVTLNGRQLTAGVDYTVDYNIGQLTILNSDALVPGANLSISYEQNDLFQLASKTLLGARGVLDLGENTNLGFSILNLNQQSLNDKVRIGEEPLSNTIMGVDFSTKQDLPFLTAALDNVISTKTMSNLSLSGEAAYIKPDPNTKKSTIPDDKGQSIAYIDDFEGAKKIIPVGIAYTSWKDLSPPGKLQQLPDLTPKEEMPYKAKALWYNITPPNVNVRDIWGTRKQVATQDQQVQTLDFVFLPDTPGVNNPTLTKPPLQTWGGMMKALSSTANDLQAQNIQYIEFWMHVSVMPPNGKSYLYIDLGRISEDMIPNGILNTEDVNHNGVIDQNEDVGIDGMNDQQEQAYYNSKKSDPGGDDFSFDPSAPWGTDAQQIAKYFHINGTEGNAVLTDIGRIPDTEDLNQNGNLDVVNSYFRYAIPLDTTHSGNNYENKYIAGGGDNAGWFLIRVPLRDTAAAVNNPSLSDVEYIRVFCQNEPGEVHVRLAEFNLAGNQWQAALPNDTVMSVSVINYEDNTNYSSPPGVQRARDHSQPDQQVYGNEQSLDLILNGLGIDSTRETVKYMYAPLDLFNYKEMKFFYHCDQSPGTNLADSSDGGYPGQLYIKFGTDTSNYYEYLLTLKPGPPENTGWLDVDIDFSKLTAIKTGLDSAQATKLYTVPVAGIPGEYYGVKGNPSLTAVKYITFGLHNHTGKYKRPRKLYGEVWLNELRVIGADNHPGFAYTASASLNLADLMSVNFNMSRTDPYFHALSDQFGSRVDTRSWSMSANLNVLKLLPFDMSGSNLKLSYSHSESIGKPLYLPGTDIRVEEAAQLAAQSRSDTLSRYSANRKTAKQITDDSQTMSVSDTWSSSGIKLQIPSNYWLIKNTIDALTLGFNYNKTFRRSPTVLSNKSWIWNATANYGINFSPDDYIEPGRLPLIGSIFSFLSDYRNLKIYYAPQNFSASLSVNRNRNITLNRQVGTSISNPIPSHDFSATRALNFLWKFTDGGLINLSTSYNLSVNSSLAYLEVGPDGQTFLPENMVWRKIFGGALFGRDYQLQQSVDIRTNPMLPSLFHLNQYLQLSGGYTVAYQWNNNFSQQEAGRSAGYTSHATVGLRLSLKSLMDPLFEASTEQNNPENFRRQGFEQNNPRPEENQNENRGERNPNREGSEGERNSIRGANRGVERENVPGREPGQNPALKDTAGVKDTTGVKVVKKPFPLVHVYYLLRSMARFLLFDYNAININLSSDNSLGRGSLMARGSGISNFWGLTFHADDGPSRLFMLGLNSNNFIRAPGQNITDSYSQRNNLDFSTSKPLWEGARIDLNWKVGWSINKSTTYQSDSVTGIATQQFLNETGSISRSFLTVPPVFFLSFLKSGINRVHQLYTYDQNDPNSAQELSNAFVQGFETLPWLSRLGFLKNFMNYIPRPNWTFNWDGLQKYPLFHSFAQSMSIQNAYTSTYTEGWNIDPTGTRVVQSQRIEYGFTPLVGINITFNRLWNGNLTGNIKYSTRSSYDLGISTQNITETFSRDIGLTASYSKSGFEFPFFGLSLKNDIEFSFSYTNSQSTTIIYNMQQWDGGIPQDGVNRISLEPRIKYTVSSKVTLSIFYQRSSTAPVGASQIPPTTTNEAGLDVHISIQ